MSSESLCIVNSVNGLRTKNSMRGSFGCGISGDLAPSTRKSLAIAIVRFWRAKPNIVSSTRVMQTKRWCMQGFRPVRGILVLKVSSSQEIPAPIKTKLALPAKSWERLRLSSASLPGIGPMSSSATHSVISAIIPVHGQF